MTNSTTTSLAGPWKTFSGIGIELEYMIVDKQSLQVKPLVEKVLRQFNHGELTDEVVVEGLRWSNELVSHVLEIKGDGPLSSFAQAGELFSGGIKKINDYLSGFGCCLLGTAMHPTMDSAKEMVLWPHGQKEIYSQFHKIFTCQGHGWSNLQSMHLNFPFQTEEEFGRLHAAIRLVLPLIPILCASSPICDNKLQAFPSMRLKFYEENQKKIPSITGHVIPEAVFNYPDYERLLEDVYRDIRPFDPEGILQYPWLNSRGAIPKFDYGCIEIRIADIQEMPLMDMAIAEFVQCLVKFQYQEKIYNWEKQMRTPTEELAQIYQRANNFNTQGGGRWFSELWGIDSQDANDSFLILVHHLFNKMQHELSPQTQSLLEQWLKQGPLAHRLKVALGQGKSIDKIYRQLASCLSENKLFTVY